jgi:midasin
MCRKRIDMCLADWPKDPVLMELVKLIGRLESFDLSEPLMKYLTGVELLLERSQNWQQVASKQYSLDEELKRLNAVVVEWRKLELKHWVTSIDIELDKAKRNSCYVWFFNLLALCVEFLTADSDETYSGEDVLKTLNQFILSSTVGDYHIRIKNFRLELINLYNSNIKLA